MNEAAKWMMAGMFLLSFHIDLNCIATCNPRFGPVAFDTMEKYLNEEKLEHIINNEEYIIDSTNAEEKLPDAF